MKDNNKDIKISYWSSHLTTIVTVTLVLLIVGLIALMSVGAHRETERLHERVELSVIMTDSISDAEAADIAKELAKEPYVAQSQLIGKQQAMEEWSRDTGEDLMSLYNVNPFSPEVVLTLKADYTSADSLASISKRLESQPYVEKASQPDVEMIENMNRGIRKVVWVLGSIALTMLLISFVLINNTVRLATYSRRFTIHTMQLVGATDGYIRGPYVRGNMLSGFLAGIASSVLLLIAMLGTESSGVLNVWAVIGWGSFGMVCGGLVLIGTLVCGAAAALATRRYLRADYDDLFR